MKSKPVLGEQLIAETPKRHYSERLIENATVSKVGRKYFSIRRENCHQDEEFLMDTWKRKGENAHVNFPINLYRTHEEMEVKHEKSKLVRLLSDNLRYASDWDKIDLEKLREVARITDLKI